MLHSRPMELVVIIVTVLTLLVSLPGAVNEVALLVQKKS